MTVKNIDLSTQQKLLLELEDLLDKFLEDNKYALIIAYEAGRKENGGTKTQTNAILAEDISNLTLESPLTVWKRIILGLMEKVESFINVYDINNSDTVD